MKNTKLNNFIEKNIKFFENEELDSIQEAKKILYHSNDMDNRHAFPKSSLIFTNIRIIHIQRTLFGSFTEVSQIVQNVAFVEKVKTSQRSWQARFVCKEITRAETMLVIKVESDSGAYNQVYQINVSF